MGVLRVGCGSGLPSASATLQCSTASVVMPSGGRFFPHALPLFDQRCTGHRLLLFGGCFGKEVLRGAVPPLQGSFPARSSSRRRVSFARPCCVACIPPPLPCTVHGTLYTVHCTLYTVHCTLYTVHCTLYCIAACMRTDVHTQADLDRGNSTRRAGH